MTKQTVSMLADLILCTTTIAAKPGDKLVVVGGICIGIMPAGAQTETTEPEEPPELPRPATRPRPGVNPPFGIEDQMIIDTILTQPLPTRDIADRLGLSRGRQHQHAREYVGRRLLTLTNKGILSRRKLGRKHAVWEVTGTHYGNDA